MNKFAMLVLSALLAACASGEAEMQTVDYVDLDRFMGDWYVIASIPTFIEKDAYNAVENYVLKPDATIETTFSFRKGGFDGELKIYTPTGFVTDMETNAEWGMQFVWPIKADYRIVYLDRKYIQTIIGRNKRDHVWVMARTPQIAESDYAELLERVAGFGYEMDKVRRVPQQW